ncbi:major capsid protein [Lysinibacillus sphaericus]|uniref:major capsid protein n=1 Tax=Lysinibacillus sphaericus TaxID=1421 RepID=UPI00055BF6AC|nr:major capsid protein [Lysinibacillus sphaericus]QTB24317.1 major capsid protein [Lysinibacillus sphaericus]
MAVNLFETRSMLKFVERMPPVQTFLKDTLFKDDELFPTKKVDIDIKKGRAKIAPYVSEKIGGKVVENSGYRTETFEPPLVAPTTITTAADIQNRSMGERLYSGRTPDERAAEKLVKDLKELDVMITRREEVMCAQAIFDGEITVKGEGVDHVISFNHTNRETLSGANLWSVSTSDKYADLKRWVRKVQATGFVNTDVVIIAPDVTDVLLKDQQILKLLDIRNVNIGEFKPENLPNGATYIGSIAGVGKIYEYSATYYDDLDDKVKPMVPGGTIALASSEVDFSMAYAAVTIAKDEDLVTYEAKRVPDTWTEKRPASKILQLSAKPLPIPKEVNSWFVAKVL